MLPWNLINPSRLRIANTANDCWTTGRFGRTGCWAKATMPSTHLSPSSSIDTPRLGRRKVWPDLIWRKDENFQILTRALSSLWRVLRLKQIWSLARFWRKGEGSIYFSAAEHVSVQEEDPELFEDEGTVPRICASWPSDKVTVCSVDKAIERHVQISQKFAASICLFCLAKWLRSEVSTLTYRAGGSTAGDSSVIGRNISQSTWGSCPWDAVGRCGEAALQPSSFQGRVSMTHVNLCDRSLHCLFYWLRLA